MIKKNAKKIFIFHFKFQISKKQMNNANKQKAIKEISK